MKIFLIRMLYRRIMLIALFITAQTYFSVPARASGLQLVSGQMAGLVQMMIANPNLCITYSYDANGNRIVQVNAAYGTAGAMWGSAVYACFSWTAP